MRDILVADANRGYDSFIWHAESTLFRHQPVPRSASRFERLSARSWLLACNFAPFFAIGMYRAPSRTFRVQAGFLLFDPFEAARFGLSIVPVQSGWPQRHSQIFFKRGVCRSPRVMP